MNRLDVVEKTLSTLKEPVMEKSNTALQTYQRTMLVQLRHLRDVALQDPSRPVPQDMEMVTN